MQHKGWISRRVWLNAGTIAALLAGSAPAPRLLAAEGGKPEKLLFVSNRAGEKKFNIFSMNPDGSEPVNLTQSNAMEFDPAWSPDHTRIAFVVMNLGKKIADIYVMNADGSQRTRLTENVGDFYAFAPAWSPDGKRIAYSTIQVSGTNGPPKAALFLMDPDGKNEKALGDGLLPIWSPDGKKIAYSVFPDNQGSKIPSLKVMDADGTNAKQLAEKGIAAAWSPDGKRLLYMNEGGGEQADLFVMDADGSHATQLTHTAEEMEFGAQWSADGKKILFTRFPKEMNGAAHVQVYAMDPDGSNVKPLTKGEAGDCLGTDAGLFVLMTRVVDHGH